jgi:enterochelin esterase-like enzyme
MKANNPGVRSMRSMLWVLCCVLVPFATRAEPAREPVLPQVEAGRVERIEFAPEGLATRKVDVWLPPGYPDAAPYATLYMHDGQMLFDASTTWNGQAWEAERTAAALIESGALRPFIVVGIWNAGAHRYRDYLPQRVFESMPDEARARWLAAEREPEQPLFAGPPAADAYVRFLVGELRETIESRFAVSRKAEDRFLMGSSMGGLISLYALLEQPQHFGGAAALSTHWPGGFDPEDDRFATAMRAYLRERLPALLEQKIWMDHGTETLDALYPPLQREVDAVFEASPLPPSQWRSREYPGTDHSERAWAARLADPLRFLLAPE